MAQVSGCAGAGFRQGAVSVVAVVAIALREVSLEPNRRSGAVRGPWGGWGRAPKGLPGALGGFVGGTAAAVSRTHKRGNAVGKWFCRAEQVCDGKDNSSSDISDCFRF